MKYTRENPPFGYRYLFRVRPVLVNSDIVWMCENHRRQDTKDCILMPRDEAKDGTCYLFEPIEMESYSN